MTAPATPRPVVVGVDGSPASHTAVELAAREAHLHHSPLRVVHAFEWPLLGVYLGPSPELPADEAGAAGLRADANRVLAEALAHAHSVSGTLGGGTPQIEGEVVTGEVSPVLLREAAGAALLVVGDRGLGGFGGLLLGSVAIQVAAHAPAPVLVARGQLRRQGPVVVGVDGSAVSQAAVGFAFAEAAARDAELLAVAAWTGRVSTEQAEQLPLIYDADDIEAAQVTALHQALAPARDQWPQVPVRELVRRGRPARVLLAAAEPAQLVVVGARGRGGFTGLLLGSVSQAMLHHAGCPVAVVRKLPDQEGADDAAGG
ncbi:universal stress protein [Natronosporangium hydrolyticum]|uniref:Universal stress protein n=1 Tax=Natronosporangium hydrolyticum TaxID=2811111 RepID=A0A895YGE0_9ACTN|nr:universal stress protein [Natronosporangium hydrolyticum]QSB16887.1 universal stress protein [Natronosporangium hydrolyticum]